MAATATQTSPSGKLAVGLGVLLLAVTAFVALGRTPSDERNRNERVVLTAAFAPTPREVPIHLIAHVGDVKVAEELLTHSWWSLEVDVPPGKRVVMQVSQETPGNLECAIIKNGETLDANTRADVGSIRCYGGW